MILHRLLDDGDPIVTFVFRVAILEVEAHELVLILAKPLLVHVHNLGCFMVVIGVDNLNLGRMCKKLTDFSVVTRNLRFLIHVSALIANLLFVIHVIVVIADLRFLIHYERETKRAVEKKEEKEEEGR
jgi:hypothetical protein